MPDINNERSVNELYKDRLKNLTNFGLFMWEQDKTIYPHETAWFTILDKEGKKIPLRQQDPFYSEDRLGLRHLDETGRLFFYKNEGDHMDLTQAIIDDYLVPLLFDDRVPTPSHY